MVSRVWLLSLVLAVVAVIVRVGVAFDYVLSSSSLLLLLLLVGLMVQQQPARTFRRTDTAESSSLAVQSGNAEVLATRLVM